jgi:tetratricopeptide (TPR) repeat protein
MRTCSALIVCALLFCAPRLLAEAVEDAEGLKAEATDILRKNATKPVSPNEFAMAVYRLEKAQSILEAGGQTGNDLAQEVNSALFWARRCSNIHVMKELDKIHAENPPLKLASQEKKKKAKADGEGPPGIDLQEDAKEAFLAAETFAKSHAGDDYMVSLRYFQMAAEYPGTDYAIKAMALARDAQIRFAIKTGSVKEEMPDSPEIAPVKEADALVADGKYEESFELYKRSFRIKDSALAHRHLGLAFFCRAQQMKDKVNADYEALVPEYKEAWQGAWMRIGKSKEKVFNDGNPRWVAAKNKQERLKVDAKNAMMRYLYAQWEFETVLKLSPNRRDFDAAAYVGISLSARPEMKPQARDYLQKFVKEYEPENETQRMIFEYAKMECDRVSQK